MPGSGMGGGGGMLMGGLTVTFEEPEPCEDEPAKTYYKCGTAAGMEWCRCECPPGKRYLATTRQCIDEDRGTPTARDERTGTRTGTGSAAAGGDGGASERSGGSVAALGGTATSESEMSETQKRQKDEVETEARERQGKPDPDPRRNWPQMEGYREQTEEDKAVIDAALEGTPTGELRDMIEKAMEVKDVTDRPDSKIRRFTINESSANLEQKAYGDFYGRFRVDVLGEQGTEIRQDKYEVIYSPMERQFMEHQFGLTLHPSEHQRVINNVFLTFADEMLKTQVRTVETFSHINQANFGNNLITANDLSDAVASIKPKFDAGQAAEFAKLQAAGVFGVPNRAAKRAFGRNNTQDPFGVMGSQARIVGGRGDKGMDLFKYAATARGSVSPKTRFTSGPGSFKVGPGGFRMELGSNLRVNKTASPTKPARGSYAKASMGSREMSKTPSSGLQRSMQGFKQRSKALTITTSGGKSAGTRKMGRPANNQANANPSPNKTMNPNRGPTKRTNNYAQSMRNKGGNY